MSLLPNFPMVSQLTPVTGDGEPSENAQDDCVAACVCAMVMYLLGKTEIDQTFNPDTFKDRAAGQNYTGFTAAAQYVDYCKQLGVLLSPINGDPSALVSQARDLIQAGTPVMFTEPDPYSSNPGWSHVCVWCGEHLGELTAMDPWGGVTFEMSDEQWSACLLFNQVWKAEKIQMELPTEVQIWQTLRADIPLVPSHGIPASWLRALAAGRFFGIALTQEEREPGGVFQVFSGGIAHWSQETGVTTWQTPAGTFTF